MVDRPRPPRRMARGGHLGHPRGVPGPHRPGVDRYAPGQPAPSHGGAGSRLTSLFSSVHDQPPRGAHMNSAQGNDSQAESPLIPELIARQAALDPDAVAVVAGRERLTYGELHRRAELAAHRLRQLGAGPDTPVGVRHGRGFDLVVGLLAIWRAGSAYLPLDPEAPQARLRALIDRSGTRLVLCEADQADAVTAAGARAVVPAHLVDDPSRGPGQRADLPPAPSLHRHNTAYVLHTSGSTGEPKGVMVSHEGAGNLIRWMVDHFGFGPGTRVLHRTPLIFDAHVWEVFAPLAAGGTLVLADAGAERDPAALVRAVAEHGVTTLQVVPSILRLMVAEDGWDRCHALRQVLSGGEQLHAELAQRLRALVDVDVWNTYGPTECSVNATAHRFDPAQSEGPVPIGRPIPGTRVLVVDATGTPVGIGVPGELLIGGAGLARGYLGRPGQTADRFVPDPYAKDASRLYRTGDRVRWTPDGVLEYLGRTDDQIKVNGVRIEPGEIESHLLDHPQVVMGTVLPYRVDDGGKRLAAYVVPASDDAPEQIEQTLRRYLLERLPASHLPSRFLFLDRLPIGPTGKVDRKALPDPAADSAATGADATVTGPAADSAGASASGPAGSGEALALVADIWRDVLGVTEAAPGDDFFRLGGTSLQIALLATRLRAAGQDITLYDLLSNPTLAAQAALLDLAPEAPAPGTDIPRLAPETRAKGVPLSPGQRRMWFLDRLNPGSPEWVAGLLLRLPEGADLPVVREALGILTDRHEALRTRYTEVGGEPAQFVRASVETPLTTVNCTRAELPAELKTLMGTGFPLDGEGPLLRGTVYRVDGGPRLLVLAMHHITTDGWSSRILEDDFHRTVDALLRGERPELPELPVQYADYAAWQQERLTSGTVEREVAHWRGVLAGVEPLSPPTDHPRPPMRDGRGSIAPLQVPAATVRALDSVAQELGTTRFAVVLTALATVLARYTGQWDVPVGAPVAGRGRPELDGVVGFFLNTVVMRCRLEPELGFTEAVRRTAEVTKDALAHQELPFDLLVDELAPKRDLSRTPLYQVAFDLHGEDFNAPDDEDLEILHRMWHLAHTDLTLLLRPQPDGSLVGGLEYATSLYEHSTATALVAALGQVLESAAAEPRGRLDRLALLGSDETRRLDRWSGSPARQPEHPAHVLIAEQALRTPDAIAVRADDGELTYRQLAQRAGQVGDRLRALGVRPDTPVGVLLDRGLDLHPALLGAWWAGAAYVPIDPEFPAERVAGMLADAGVRVLLTDERGQRGSPTRSRGGSSPSAEGSF
ncbi:dimodular nonribosomal peptide synthetase [Streptomyces clavuligerus]|nr:dimodular nonribosomal peptide synthetase [Streptomyces clavuligerus]